MEASYLCTESGASVSLIICYVISVGNRNEVTSCDRKTVESVNLTTVGVSRAGTTIITIIVIDVGVINTAAKTSPGRTAEACYSGGVWAFVCSSLSLREGRGEGGR